MPLRWTPRFTFGPEGDTESITLSYPVEVFIHGGRTGGTSRRTASGVPHASIPQRYRTIGLTLRFQDTEWAAVRRMVVWGQSGAPFLWSPGDLEDLEQTEADVTVLLDAPRVRDGFTPERDTDMPWLMRLSIVLCRADRDPWSIEYFKSEPPFEATGGAIVEANGYRSHIFGEDGDFEVLSGEVDIEVLLVAGGGGGSGSTGTGLAGGAGGAGGVRTFTRTVTTGVFPVVIGAGGLGRSNAKGDSGLPSSFDDESVTGGGGGGGGTFGNRDGNPGGSGGGGATLNNTAGLGGAGTVDQGHNGGNGRSDTADGTLLRGGGGGGASEAGHNGTAVDDADGGAGVTNDFSGVLESYGGGGGGGSGTGVAAGQGGLGGGGNGGFGAQAGFNATDGTGGGGGGAGSGSGVKAGGNGAKGKVIVRYLI